MPMSPPQRLSAALSSGMMLGVLLVLMVAGSQMRPRQGLAAEATPPSPPTFVPTPIGSPPAPPTFTPTAAAVGSPTAAATETQAATGTATAVVRRAAFTLDAARVALPDNPGNFAGLLSVKPGTRVWLMMYYTVHTLPSKTTRATTYQIMYGSKTIFKVGYRSSIKPSELGRYSRYQVFDVPAGLPFGRYSFKAVLSIAGMQRSRTWHFSIGSKTVQVKSSGSA
jgi:hypothetical protein